MQNKNSKELLYRNDDMKHRRGKSQEKPSLNNSISIENNKPISEKNVQMVVHDFRNAEHQNGSYINNNDSFQNVSMNIVNHQDGLVPLTQYVSLPANVVLNSMLVNVGNRRELTKEEMENINAQVSRNLPYCNKELAKHTAKEAVEGTFVALFMLAQGAAIYSTPAAISTKSIAPVLAAMKAPGVAGYVGSALGGLAVGVTVGLVGGSCYTYKKRKDMKNNLTQSALNNNLGGFIVEQNVQNPDIQQNQSSLVDFSQIQDEGQIDALNTGMRLNDEESIGSIPNERSHIDIELQRRNNNSSKYVLDI